MNDFTEHSAVQEGEPLTQRSSTSYELFIFGLTIFSLLVVIAMIFGPTRYQIDSVLWRVDSLICIIFLIDFFINLKRAPDRKRYFFGQGGWLDLLGCVPASPVRVWLAFLRFARLNRMLRIWQHLRGKDRQEMIAEARDKSTQTALLSIILIAIMLITFSSLLILPLERGATGVQIETGADAFWWSFVTVTTVGYGDYTPVTFPGRVMAMVLMTLGIGIFAVLTSFVADRLSGESDENKMLQLIKEENSVLKAELVEIKTLLLGLTDKGSNE